MKKDDVKVLVLTGDGINCEVETSNAFKLTGASVTISHVADLLEKPTLLDNYHILALPLNFDCK